METILGIIILIVLTFFIARDKDNDRKKTKRSYKKYQKTESTSARSDESQNKTNKEAKDKIEQVSTFGKSLEEIEELLKRLKKKFGKLTSSSDTGVLKLRGDGYELHIGRKFEIKGGNLVIYNGLIRGYEDQGVDVIVLSKSSQSIHLIQCKHWKRYEFTKEHLQKIYSKLNNFRPDYDSINLDDINYYLSLKRNTTDIFDIIQKSAHFTQTRKTLYLSSKNVVKEEIWERIQFIKDDIYRYKDMKIVFHKIH